MSDEVQIFVNGVKEVEEEVVGVLLIVVIEARGRRDDVLKSGKNMSVTAQNIEFEKAGTDSESSSSNDFVSATRHGIEENRQSLLLDMSDRSWGSRTLKKKTNLGNLTLRTIVILCIDFPTILSTYRNNTSYQLSRTF